MVIYFCCPQVKWVEQQQVLERDKRSIIPDFVGIEHPRAVIVQDPMFKDQWYLVSCNSSKRLFERLKVNVSSRMKTVPPAPSLFPSSCINYLFNQ